MDRARRQLIGLSLIATLALVASGIAPRDRATWAMEVAPVVIALPILWLTCARFPLTGLLYALIGLHACILCLGGKYTYAEVPLGFWVQDWLDLGRNHYDRLGHLAQGFVPAVAAREVLIRLGVVRGAGWTFFVATAVVLATSATYELVEWAAAISLGQAADAFLGTQGDPWDTQWDMFLALLGALASQLALGRVHDRALERLG